MHRAATRTVRLKIAALAIVLSGCVTASDTIPAYEPDPASRFFGRLELLANPDDPGTRILASNFGFRDANSLAWQTNAGDVTDGASIPELLQPIVGSAYDVRFIRAAVIHDRYCDEGMKRRVREWRPTHRMFYEALLEAGVETTKAKLMYYAVHAFGPRWDYLDAGSPCAGGTENCIQMTVSRNVVYRYRPALYNQPGARSELNDVWARLRRDPAMTPEQIAALSDERNPGDPFLTMTARSGRNGLPVR